MKERRYLWPKLNTYHMAFAAIAGLATAIGTAAYGVGSGLASRKKQRRIQNEYARNIEAALENRETSKDGTAEAMRMTQDAARAAKYLRGQMAVNGDSTEQAAAGVEKIGDSMAERDRATTQSIRDDIRDDSNVRIGLQKEVSDQKREDEKEKQQAISTAVKAGGDIAGDIFAMGDVDTSTSSNTATQTVSAQSEATAAKMAPEMKARLDKMTADNTKAGLASLGASGTGTGSNAGASGGSSSAQDSATAVTAANMANNMNSFGQNTGIWDTADEKKDGGWNPNTYRWDTNRGPLVGAGDGSYEDYLKYDRTARNSGTV